MAKPEDCSRYGTNKCCGFEAQQEGIKFTKVVRNTTLVLDKVESRARIYKPKDCPLRPR